MSEPREVLLIGLAARTSEHSTIGPQEGAIDTPGEIARLLESPKPLILVTYESVRLIEAVLPAAEQRLPHDVVLLEPSSGESRIARLGVLRRAFAEVRDLGDGIRMLPPNDLRLALASPDARDLAIGVARDPVTGIIAVLRGDFETLLLSERDFTGRAPLQPDFSDLAPDDCGLTIRAGSFEAAFDALLYERDPAYRRRARARLREADQSLGASIRRLRKQRGLRQSDFPGISRKQIARIENGETRAPHPATLNVIAQTLGVGPQDLQDF